MPGALIPIHEVARLLGINASTIRYYDERGLVTPVSRAAGRRWYDEAGVRQLAVVRYWQSIGLFSLDDIAALLAGRHDDQRGWSEIMSDHLDALASKIDQLRAATDLLEHILEHHPDQPPDGCVHYEHLLFGLDVPDEPETAGQSVIDAVTTSTI